MAENDQKFDSFTQWVNKASSWLTRHDDYHPERFRAICYDSKGRRCAIGGDFMRARDEGTFPVSWLWPDQIAEMAAKLAQYESQEADASAAAEADIQERDMTPKQFVEMVSRFLPPMDDGEDNRDTLARLITEARAIVASAPPAPEVAEQIVAAIKYLERVIASGGTNSEDAWEEYDVKGCEIATLIRTLAAMIVELEAALKQVHDMGQSAFADHWAFRKAARDITSAALAGEQAPPAEASDA